MNLFVTTDKSSWSKGDGHGNRELLQSLKSLIVDTSLESKLGWNTIITQLNHVDGGWLLDLSSSSLFLKEVEPSGTFASLCHCPNVNLPHWYKVQIWKKLDGKGDPQNHLRLFVNDTFPVRENKDNLIYLFQKSNEGKAAAWFGSLPVGSFSTFEELADKFMSQYSYLSGKKPTITDLQDTIQGANENVQSFVIRFRELLVKTEIVIPEPHFFLLFESSLPSLYQSSA